MTMAQPKTSKSWWKNSKNNKSQKVIQIDNVDCSQSPRVKRYGSQKLISTEKVEKQSNDSFEVLDEDEDIKKAKREMEQ